MKVLILVALCVARCAAAPEEPLRHYHEAIGVPEAERIRAAEEAAGPNVGRIVGGWDAPLGDFSFVGGLVITLTTGQTSVCGSTMLSHTRSLTAAHCWWDGPNQARSFTVVFGSKMLFAGGVRVTTSSVEMHNNYNPVNLSNDLAMISHSFVTYSEKIAPVTLPTGNLLTNLFVGWTALTAGFGRTSDNAGITSYQSLRYAQLPVITNAVCQQTYGNVVTAASVCTSGASGRGACGGDSGNPLVIISGEDKVLIGVTLFGSARGCESGLPTVYQRVASFNAWITSRI